MCVCVGGGYSVFAKQSNNENIGPGLLILALQALPEATWITFQFQMKYSVRKKGVKP